LAGLARAALVGSPPDVETAKELVASARQVAVEGLPPAPPGTPDQPPPAEVGAAEAYIALLEDVASSSAESTDAAAPSEAEAAAAAAHARAVQQFLSGDVDGALEDALWLVRKHRSWRNMAGRALVLRLADALGPDPRAEKARRRLSNLWFA
jgi:thioredoxin-like negative regulator of GroEL